MTRHFNEQNILLFSGNSMTYLFNLINAHIWPSVFTYRHRPESTSGDRQISLPYQKPIHLLLAIQISLFGTQDLLIDIKGELDGTDLFLSWWKLLFLSLTYRGRTTSSQFRFRFRIRSWQIHHSFSYNFLYAAVSILKVNGTLFFCKSDHIQFTVPDWLDTIIQIIVYCYVHGQFLRNTICPWPKQLGHWNIDTVHGQNLAMTIFHWAWANSLSSKYFSQHDLCMAMMGKGLKYNFCINCLIC